MRSVGPDCLGCTNDGYEYAGDWGADPDRKAACKRLGWWVNWMVEDVAGAGPSLTLRMTLGREPVFVSSLEYWGIRHSDFRFEI